MRAANDVLFRVLVWNVVLRVLQSWRRSRSIGLRLLISHIHIISLFSHSQGEAEDFSSLYYSCSLELGEYRLDPRLRFSAHSASIMVGFGHFILHVHMRMLGPPSLMYPSIRLPFLVLLLLVGGVLATGPSQQADSYVTRLRRLQHAAMLDENRDHLSDADAQVTVTDGDAR